MPRPSWRSHLASWPNALFKERPAGSIYSVRFLPLLYLIICVPTVLFLVFFRQPLGNPDEVSHVARAYQISKGVILTEEAVPGLHPKGMVDNAWFRLGSEVNKRRFESLDTALPVFQEFGWSGTERLRRFNSSVYFPAAFIPQAVGLKIAQALDLRLVQSLQLASMLNAVICFLIISIAIHVAAEGKHFIALIGALPMTLHQLASTSPDGLVIAGSLLMFALTITAVVQRRVSSSTVFAVVVLGAFTGATKLPYLPVALVALAALWWAEPRPRKGAVKYILACMALVLIPVLWAKISNAGAVKHSIRIQTDPGDQIAYLLSHPLEIPGLAFSTLYAHLHSYLSQIVGVLGWLDAPLPHGVYVILGLGFAAVLVMDGVSVQPLIRWIALAGFTISVALIFLSLYLIWNPLGSPGPIEGVQGRYFLPILPFLVFLLPRSERFRSESLKLSVFTFCGLVGSLATVATIIKRYYS